MKNYTFMLLVLLTFVCCSDRHDHLTEPGVSKALAEYRSEKYSDITYNLSFSIPVEKDKPVSGSLKLELTLKDRSDIVLDFTGGENSLLEVILNGNIVKKTIKNGHLFIPLTETLVGNNTIEVEFTAGDMSLNRRDEFLYTLLVPDRARTVFPCFDQPDMKATYNLELTLPAHWTAIANGKESSTSIDGDNKTVRFEPTEPLSTYLFSFVCGQFEKVRGEKDGRVIELYHRETDPAKTSQCGDILEEVFASLEWLEEYTTIPYPFKKYDLIIIPGFQYGGMEHTGATLYNDRTMFLEENPTITQRLKRSSLIAHETAHMWFGDLVTMKWFSDVWNKEVFANWYAAQIVRPHYPEINHDLNFVRAYVPYAYGEDRTRGAQPIQQNLDNLSNAGLVYSDIVYCKSPLVMDMLVRKTGWDNFRAAIIEYLKTYSYGNTDWDGLVAILDRQSPDDLEQWSRSWVKKPGMPVIDISYEKGNLAIVQSDILGENVIRDQSFGVTFFKRDKTEVVRIDLEEAQYHLNLGGEYDFFIPNSDFHGYGYFRTSTENILSALLKLPTIYDAVMKYSIIINTHEAVLNGDFDPVKYISGLIPYLRDETDELLFAEGLRTVENIVGIFLYNQSEAMRTYEEFLSQTISNGKTQAQKIYASQAYCRSAHTPAAMQDLLEIWQNEGRHTQYFLGERDLTSLSYRLAAYYPDKSKEITETQLSRISNPDRRDEYIWISRAVDPDPEVRNDFFKELLLPENRTIEPRVLTALSLLNKPENMPYALDYVIPALEELDGVQKTGDIFMPAGWCYALLGSHRTPEALDKVNVFLDRNPELNPLLRSKILINADELRRAFEYSNRVN